MWSMSGGALPRDFRRKSSAPRRKSGRRSPGFERATCWMRCLPLETTRVFRGGCGLPSAAVRGSWIPPSPSRPRIPRSGCCPSMSEDAPRIVDIKSWVDRARRDPAAYVERQATEIVLSAIGSLPGYGSRIFLKGGILMAVVYESPRGTADIDFTTDLEPSPELPANLRDALDKELPRAAARLGFPDLVLRVQTVKERPRPFKTADLQFPALYVTIAYAKRGSGAERHILNGQGQHVIELEVSFNEPVHAIEVVRFGASGPSFSA